jgi:hypothetical protein
VDAAGKVVAGPKAFSGSGWLRQLLDRPFGERVRFQVSACNVWGAYEYCGEFSQTYQAAAPSLTFVLPGYASEWSPNPDPTPGVSPGSGDGVPGGQGAGDESGTATDTAGVRTDTTDPVLGTRRFSWTNNPANGSVPAPTYRCGAAGVEGTPGEKSCTIENIEKTAAAWLDITYTVDGESLTRRITK